MGSWEPGNVFYHAVGRVRENTLEESGADHCRPPCAGLEGGPLTEGLLICSQAGGQPPVPTRPGLQAGFLPSAVE